MEVQVQLQLQLQLQVQVKLQPAGQVEMFQPRDSKEASLRLNVWVYIAMSGTAAEVRLEEGQADQEQPPSKVKRVLRRLHWQFPSSDLF